MFFLTKNAINVNIDFTQVCPKLKYQTFILLISLSNNYFSILVNGSR